MSTIIERTHDEIAEKISAVKTLAEAVALKAELEALIKDIKSNTDGSYDAMATDHDLIELITEAIDGPLCDAYMALEYEAYLSEKHA